MKDLVAHEIRRLHRKIQQADRRMGMVDIAGKVKPGSQDMQKRTVRLVIGQTPDGQDILSPPVRWQGTASGDFMMHAVPADNEQMVLHSPSGTIGNGSMAHWGTYDQDHQPPTTDKNQAVLKRGKGSIEWHDDKLVVKFGDSSGCEITDQGLQMLGPFKAKGGSQPATWQGSSDSGGYINTEGNPNILV